jgi:hypothetical protein
VQGEQKENTLAKMRSLMIDKLAQSIRGSEKLPNVAETLNFKVTARFKKEFKGYAVDQGMTMVDLLKEGFDPSKATRKPQ